MCFVYYHMATPYLRNAFKGAWCKRKLLLQSKSVPVEMAQMKLLLFFACVSAVFLEYEAAVATPEQIAIAATGESSKFTYHYNVVIFVAARNSRNYYYIHVRACIP